MTTFTNDLLRPKSDEKLYITYFINLSNLDKKKANDFKIAVNLMELVHP